jgi:hypothetical protein
VAVIAQLSVEIPAHDLSTMLDQFSKCVQVTPCADADSATRKGMLFMSQNDLLPEAKPDLMVKAWVFVIAARGPLAIYAGLVALAMLLASVVLIKLFGH